MRLIFLLIPFFAAAQDSCVVFDPEINYQARMMGYTPDPPSWKEINYVVHIHHTDSIPYSYISDNVVYDAHDHLNEEFEEAMLSFNLISIEYHDFDDFWAAPVILESTNICFPYGGYYYMNDYVEPLIWDRTQFMNVHIFPKFCGSILGFAWTSYVENADADGVWIRYDVFGRFGDHLGYDDRQENKTMIHEVGHYVSLHHVFRNIDFCGQNLGPCGETGDYVCDTPPTKLNWSCENPICPPGLYNYTPNNHMDYYVDSCRTSFTEGQIERMHVMLPITRPGIIYNDQEVCQGDLDGDMVVGMNDLLLVLSNYQNPYWEEGDIDGDGMFTIFDFQIILINWGSICYGAELDPFYREEQLKFPKQERGRSPFPFR